MAFHQDGSSCDQHSLTHSLTHSLIYGTCVVPSVKIDDLVTQGARASAAMVSRLHEINLCLP